MKKIFAFVLATIMVLSLVPASAFAAFTKCPTTHTSTNCDAKLISTTLADCQNVGFQVYVCNDCGEQFVDNYVQKLEHTWVSDEDFAAGDIKASCIYKTNGVAYLECAVCEDKTVETVKWNSTDVHDVKYVSGVGCAKLYACSICQAEGYLAVDAEGDTILADEAAHNYTFTKILVEPKWENGKGSNGTALFTCSNIVDADGKVTFEGCGTVKEVVIENPSCNKHGKEYWDDFKVVQAAVAPTCTTAGYYLVVKCPDCGKLYYDKNADNDPKTKNYEALSDLNDDDATNKEDAKISALGHSAAPAGVNCQGTYVCTVCGVTVTGSHAYGSWVVVTERNCLVQEYKYRVCSVCGNINTKTTKAKGHDIKKQFISATCAQQGGYFEYCNRTDCPLPKSEKTDPITKVTYSLPFTGGATYIGVDPDGHVLSTESAGQITSNDLFCSQAGYTITTCANNCPTYAGGKIELSAAVEHTKYIYKQSHNYTKSTKTLAAYTTRTIYRCAKCDWESDNVDVVDTTTKNTFSSVNEALVYHGLAFAYYKYDKKKTQVIDYYEGRDKMTLAEATAKFIPQGSTTGSCTVDAVATYFCTDCGMYVYINTGKLPHTEGKFTEGYPSTCTKPGMHDTYVCTECNVTFWYSGTSQKTSSPVINPCAGNVDADGNPIALVEHKDCDGAGTKYYECQVCHTFYTGTDCAKKYIPAGHKWTYLLQGVAATCNTAGLPEVRYCSTCKALEINTIYEVAGEEVRINFNTAGTNYKAGEVVVVLGKDQKLNKNSVVVRVSASGSISYDYLSITQYSWPSDVNVVKMEQIAKDSDKNEHWAPYIKATGELAVGTVKAADAKASNIEWKTAITTPINSNKDNDTTVDHTQPYFKLNYCVACEYEFINSYSPATYGHVNSKGSILTTDCSNEGVPGDRTCVVCDQEILVDHEWSESKGDSTATCVKTGVSYKYCTECGHYEFSGDIVLPDANAFHTSLINGTNEAYEAEVVGTLLDYAHNGASYLACPECGVALSEYEEEEMKANGLEIYLSTDAEEYIPGSKVYVTVTLDSLNGVNVWALNFPVIFDAEIFDYVGYEFKTADSAFQTFAVNEVAGGYEYARVPVAVGMAYGTLTDGKPAESGIVSIVANADADVYVKGAQELVVLEFVVTSAAAAEDVSFEIYEIDGPAVATLGKQLKDIDPEIPAAYANLYQLIVTGEPKTFGIDVRNANGRKVDVLKNEYSESNEIVITEFLELDGEKDITLGDAYVLYSLIYNNEYDVKADADFDGYVTAKDLSILYAILTGAVTVDQIVSPDAELPEGWYAGLGAK